MSKINSKLICIVAILKNEEPFLDEWLLYHRMIGINHFILYDDSPDFCLQEYLKPHAKYVTVVNWYGMDKTMQGKSSQTKAYNHALQELALCYQWVAFIDGDEFIVLREQKKIGHFLSSFNDAISSVFLNWYVFGHNGYYDDPTDLVTSSLVRRMKTASNMCKSITRTAAINSISSAHFCALKYGSSIGVPSLHPENSTDSEIKKAHINHYQCRSFMRWINRAERGFVSFDRNKPLPTEQIWKTTKENCLKEFVNTIAKDRNEYEDLYMLRYRNKLKTGIKQLKRPIVAAK